MNMEGKESRWCAARRIRVQDEVSRPIGLGQYEFMKAVGWQGKARNILYGLRLLVSIGNRINER
jgi:hypothetical protein